MEDDFTAKRRSACITGPLYFSSFWKRLLHSNPASKYSLKLQNRTPSILSIVDLDAISSFTRSSTLQHLATFIKETSKRQLPKETSTLRTAASQLDRLYFHSSPVSKAHMPFPMKKEVTKKSQSQKSPIPPAAAPQGMQTDYCSDYSQIPPNLHRLETP